MLGFWCFGFRASGFGAWVQGLGVLERLTISGLWVRLAAFNFGFWGFGISWGCGLGVGGLVLRLRGQSVGIEIGIQGSGV